MNPNSEQQAVIDRHDGVLAVDAGAGTGKTFTVVRRVRSMLEEGIDPSDLYLLTFTDNGAEEMGERLGFPEDMFIGTFHSLCQQLVTDEPPLGLNGSFNDPDLLSDASEKGLIFRQFYESFRSNHPEYDKRDRLVSDPVNLLYTIEQLAARGVFPEEDGWYANGRSILQGDRDDFENRLETVNAPREGSRGLRQSELRDNLSSYRYERVAPDAPDIQELRGERGDKQANVDLIKDAFEEDRSGLETFIHDLYRSYLQHQVDQNYRTFSTLQGFGYLQLNEQTGVRDAVQRPYVIVDEFQDTSSLQFKLSLLLASEPNLCVVGDYNQSIYSFQYADVENLRSFEERLNQYQQSVASDIFEGVDPDRIELTTNYRSGTNIIETAKEALAAPASRRESVDESRVDEYPPVTSGRSADGLVQTVRTEDEPAFISQSVQSADVSLGDMTVLTRTRSFARDVEEQFRKDGVPVTFRGGQKLFTSPEALRTLAWLRVSTGSNPERGWATILDDAGYEPDAVMHYLDHLDDLPDEYHNFREELRESDNPIDRIMEAYDQEDSDFADYVDERTYIESPEGWLDVIERGVEDGAVVDCGSSDETGVTVQTIHQAKGSEYERVYLADVNKRHFPSYTSNDGWIQFQEPIGLRARKQWDESVDYPVTNWTYTVLQDCISGQYDEERRLLHVAMTRAEDELIITGEDGEVSPFFEHIEETLEEMDEPMTETACMEPSI